MAADHASTLQITGRNLDVDLDLDFDLDLDHSLGTRQLPMFVF